jgi:hypothetical protein
MKTFTIDNDNNISAFATPEEAAAVFAARIFLLGAAGEQEENGLGASASGPART